MPGQAPQKQGITLPQAIFISAVFSLVVGLIMFALPFMLGYGVCVGLSWIGWCNPQALVIAFVTAVGVVTVLGTLGGVAVFFIWRALPPGAGVVIGIFLFLAGLLLVQPELDVVGVLGVLFSLKGVSKAPIRALPGGR